MNELHEFLEKDRRSKLNRQRKPPYRKPESIKDLERFHFERKQAKRPGLPCHEKTDQKHVV